MDFTEREWQELYRVAERINASSEASVVTAELVAYMLEVLPGGRDSLRWKIERADKDKAASEPRR